MPTDSIKVWNYDDLTIYLNGIVIPNFQFSLLELFHLLENDILLKKFSL